MEARDLIADLRFYILEYKMPIGLDLVRARPNHDNEHFKSRYELSYKPQRLNHFYQRASAPSRTMFYGAFCPDASTHPNARVVSTVESLKWMRDKTRSGYQIITYGVWNIYEQLELAVILYPSEKSPPIPAMADMEKYFHGLIESLPPDTKANTLAVLNFFAREFTKDNIRGDYDYLLSAALTDVLVSRGMDGVLYPSAPLKGNGFNVALTPEAVDSKLELRAVGECSVYKSGDQTIIDNEAVAQLKPSETTFELLPRRIGEYHLGRDECLRQLGVKDVEDLR